jgi:putative glycosyltransferase (TIGR04372 family)
MFRKIYNQINQYPSIIFFLVPSILFLICLIIAYPVKKIKIFLIRSHRIGHFAADVELYLLEKKEFHKSEITFFYFVRPVCNYALAEMWKREINILPSIIMRPLDLIIRSVPFLNFLIAKSANFDRDVYNLLDKYPSQIKFTKSEIERGISKLLEFGLNQNSSFVCLIVRDSAYLSNTNISDQSNEYRNSKIENYLTACNELTKLGYYVFRMGSIVTTKITTDNPMIIDYANNGMRSDFMDIFLGANCKFCISNGTGFDAIPNIFRKHIVFVNYSPLEYVFSSSQRYLTIFKYVFSVSQNRCLKFYEILNNGFGLYLSTSEFNLSNLKLIENSADEIRDVVFEMHHQYSDNLILYPFDKLQSLFWQQFYDNSQWNKKNTIPLHGKVLSRIGNSYLKKNKILLNIINEK